MKTRKIYNTDKTLLAEMAIVLAFVAVLDENSSDSLGSFPSSNEYLKLMATIAILARVHYKMLLKGVKENPKKIPDVKREIDALLFGIVKGEILGESIDDYLAKEKSKQQGENL